MTPNEEKRIIDGIPICVLPDAQTAIVALESRLKNQKEPIHLAFVNAHVVNVANRNEEYRKILNQTDLNLADGFGVWLASKFLYGEGLVNLNGTDFGIHLLNWASQKQYRVFFLGSKPNVSYLASQKLGRTIQDLKIAGCHHGYFTNEGVMKVIDEINATGADLVIVCLGVPKQDLWIHQYKNFLNVKILAGMGAFLDFHSGIIRRAPTMIRKAHLEWCFRLIQEPKRLWKRYLIGNPSFVLRTARNKNNNAHSA